MMDSLGPYNSGLDRARELVVPSGTGAEYAFLKEESV